MTATQPLHAVPTPPPTPDLDSEVRRYLELEQRAEEIGAEMRQIRQRLETLVGVGNTIATSYGVKVAVRGPSRHFDLKAAVELVRHRDPETLERCRLDGYDAAKIKKQLTGEQLEWAMVVGTGANVVTIK